MSDLNKFFVVYKVINTTTGKVYVGAHKTNNLNDSYMGSGKLIKRAINKYGISSFRKEYIAIFDNREDMYKLEAALVDSKFINSPDSYNIVTGGLGGWDYVNKTYDKDLRVLHGKLYGKKAGGWKNVEKRRKILEHMPMEKRKKIGENLGRNFGGSNRLSESTVNMRLYLIENIDLTKYGWVNKVSKILSITHTQARRFIKRNYIKEYYTRKRGA